MLCARPTGDRHRRKKRDGAMSNFDQDQGTRLPSFKYMYSTVLPLCSTLIPICRKNDCVSHIHPPIRAGAQTAQSSWPPCSRSPP